MKRALRRFLRRRGATDTEIDNAEEHGYLALLVLDREILPGERKYTMRDLAERAGTDIDTARTVWRAIGFPDLADDLRAFTDGDVGALRALVHRVESGSIFEWSLQRALPQARVLSSALARVADAETDDFASSIELARRSGLGDEELALLLARRLDFREIAELIDHAHRIQLRAAIWRRLAGTEPGTPATIDGGIGFVDLVGYTALSNVLEPEQLGELVTHFGELAHDTAARQGGRIVKTIGDEVMFVTESATVGAAIAVELVERSAADEMLPAVRAGVAFGPLLAREGDYFGPVVNLASRLTEIARPGQVLASAELVAGLVPAVGIAPRRSFSRRIRDIGRVEIFRLERR